MEAAAENVNVYVIKEQIQTIIAGIVPDLILLGVPEASSFMYYTSFNKSSENFGYRVEIF